MEIKRHYFISALEDFVEHGLDVNIKDKEGNTALDRILSQSLQSEWKLETAFPALRVVEILLGKKARIKSQQQAFKVLKESIKYYRSFVPINEKWSDIGMIRLVISGGITSSDGTRHEVDINYRDKEGNTALSLAYEEKKHDIIKLLIEKGADPKTIIPSTGKNFVIHAIEDGLLDLIPSYDFGVILENGLTPIIVAISSGNYGSLKTLIEKHKVDINFSDNFGRKAIHYAAAGGSTEIVKYLLSHCADVHSLDKYGIKPIRFAIENNRFNNFQILLNNGASLEMKDFSGVTSIDPFIVIAALMYNHSITEALLKDERVKIDDVLGCQFDYNDNGKECRSKILEFAAENNRLDIFEALKPYIKSEHIKNHYSYTPLHLALSDNNIDIVKFILSIPNIDLNAIESSCPKPSLIICSKSSGALFMLIEKGLNVQNPKAQNNLLTLAVKFVEENRPLSKLK